MEITGLKDQTELNYLADKLDQTGHNDQTELNFHSDKLELSAAFLYEQL